MGYSWVLRNTSFINKECLVALRRVPDHKMVEFAYTDLAGDLCIVTEAQKGWTHLAELVWNLAL